MLAIILYKILKKNLLWCVLDIGLESWVGCELSIQHWWIMNIKTIEHL